MRMSAVRMDARAGALVCMCLIASAVPGVGATGGRGRVPSDSAPREHAEAVSGCAMQGLLKFSADVADGGADDDSFKTCPSTSALRSWQQLKFGLFLHWGAYSQIGVDASWRCAPPVF